MRLLTAVRIVRQLGLDYGIRNYIGGLHVSTKEADVEADMTARVLKSQKRPMGPDAKRLGLETSTKAVVAYSLAVHRRNRRIYQQVVGGRIR